MKADLNTTEPGTHVFRQVLTSRPLVEKLPLSSPPIDTENCLSVLVGEKIKLPFYDLPARSHPYHDRAWRE